MNFNYQIYLCDRFNHKVLCWDPNTNKIEIVAGDTDDTKSDQALKEPYGLAVDSENNLIIADKFHKRLCRLKDKKLQKIITKQKKHNSEAKDAEYYPQTPTGMWTETNGSLLVSYCDEHNIYRVKPNGELELVIGVPLEKNIPLRGFVEHIPIDKIHSLPIDLPTNLTSTPNGDIYFVERGFQSIRKYDSKHGLTSLFPRSLKEKFAKSRQVPDKLSINSYHPICPTDIKANGNHTLFLADSWHCCVFEIDLKTGKMIKAATFAPQTNNGPSAITLGPDKILWVYDGGQKTITGFAKSNGAWQQLQTKCDLKTQDPSCTAYAGTGLICK